MLEEHRYNMDSKACNEIVREFSINARENQYPQSRQRKFDYRDKYNVPELEIICRGYIEFLFAAVASNHAGQ